jgi:hypothetical protein
MMNRIVAYVTNSSRMIDAARRALLIRVSPVRNIGKYDYHLRTGIYQTKRVKDSDIYHIVLGSTGIEKITPL